MRRLARDVGDLMKNPLDDQGIYYYHDEADFTHGVAVISGPKDSLYEHGFYLFDLKFTNKFPAEPPKVTFKTTARSFGIKPGANQTSPDFVRLHPNLYINGKVCLSLLGTWDGEPWTSCCTIRSLLLVIQSLLDGDPYMHEPNVRPEDRSHEPYNQAIAFHNLLDGVLNFKRRVLPTLPYDLRHRLSSPLAKSVSIAHTISQTRAKTSCDPIWIDKYNFATKCDYNYLIQQLRQELLGEMTYDSFKGTNGHKLIERPCTLSP